jgi:hypothetical protein
MMMVKGGRGQRRRKGIEACKGAGQCGGRIRVEEVYRHRVKQHIACGELLRDIIRLGVGRESLTYRWRIEVNR